MTHGVTYHSVTGGRGGVERDPFTRNCRLGGGGEQSDSPSSCLSWLLDFGKECRANATRATAEWGGVEGKV